MIKKLLILSLITIPFYEVVLYFFIPGRSYPLFPDLRITKDFIAMAYCLMIGSAVLSTVGFKKIVNVWIPIFLIFLIFNIYKSPDVNVMILGENFNRMWNWQAAFKVFTYFFLFLGVSSLEFTRKDLILVFKTIAISGFIMSVYMLMQRFGLDQIFDVKSIDLIGQPKNPEMAGCIGQPTISAPFIVLTIPFMLYFKRYIFSLVMACTVILTESAFAILGLCCIPVYFILKAAKGKFSFIIRLILILCCVVGIFYGLNQYKPDVFESNGRFEIWELTFKELFNERISLTGSGIGAYRYLFTLKGGHTWKQAHNDYLQLLWSTGILGIFIVFMMLKNLMFHVKHLKYIEVNIIMASLFSIFVIAFGTFPFQLAVYQYYVVVMIGIIYSLTLNKENCDGRS